MLVVERGGRRSFPPRTNVSSLTNYAIARYSRATTGNRRSLFTVALLKRNKLQIAIEGLGTLGLKEDLPLAGAQVGGLVHQLAVHKIFHVIVVDHQFQLVPFS